MLALYWCYCVISFQLFLKVCIKSKPVQWLSIWLYHTSNKFPAFPLVKIMSHDSTIFYYMWSATKHMELVKFKMASYIIWCSSPCMEPLCEDVKCAETDVSLLCSGHKVHTKPVHRRVSIHIHMWVYYFRNSKCIKHSVMKYANKS